MGYYFQNVFAEEFIGSLVLGDRHHQPSFKCRPNTGRGNNIVIAWNEPTYNLSGTDSDSTSTANLTLYFANDPNFKIWIPIVVNVAAGAVSSSAVTAAEIVTNLNASAAFSERFTASLGKFNSGKDRITITQKASVDKLHFYVGNGAAESVIGFNKRAGVDALPAYFDRHTIANKDTYSDGLCRLIKLSGTNIANNLIDAAVDYAGKSLHYSHSAVPADWQLLRGRSGLFQFTKNTYDSNTPPRVLTSIQYPAGALAGDFAKKTTYSYTSTNVLPDQVTEYPYVLQSGDLVTPT